MNGRARVFGIMAAAVLGTAGAVHAPLPLPHTIGGAEMAQAKLDKRLATAGQWRITQIGAEILPEDTMLSIHFEGPNATFFGGCNTIQTLALFGAQSFRFDVGGMTKKHCGDAVMAQEAALLEVIGQVDLLSVPEAGVLGFYDRDNKLIMGALRVEDG